MNLQEPATGVDVSAASDALADVIVVGMGPGGEDAAGRLAAGSGQLPDFAARLIS